MKKLLILFIATFSVGAIGALAFRAATFDPHASGTATASSVAEVPSPDAAPTSEGAPTTPNKPVNTVCAICGMNVDPSLPTATYKGKTIGFGCRMCPSTFRSDPDHYGPYYLRNEVIEH